MSDKENIREQVEEASKCPVCGGIVAYDSYYRVRCCTRIGCSYTDQRTTPPSDEAVREALSRLRDNSGYWGDAAVWEESRYQADLATLEAAIQQRDAVIEAAGKTITNHLLGWCGPDFKTPCCIECDGEGTPDHDDVPHSPNCSVGAYFAALSTHDGGEGE